MVPLIEIFCSIDDFCKTFEEAMKACALPSATKKRHRPHLMSLSEIMTILILFQLSGYKTFKDFYVNNIHHYHKKDFPHLLSYSRFIRLIPEAFMPLLMFLRGMQGQKTGKYYIDSTKLPVCHNLRINAHKVFKDVAKRGKTSTGWFFGFKLHLVVNEKGELMNFRLTPGNVDDRKVVEGLAKNLNGWLFGDRGYMDKKLSKRLLEKGIELVTKVRKNMKDNILEPIKKYLLKKRNIIETIIDQLKNILTMDHTRHRSIINFQVHLLAGLLAYVFKPKKPSVSFHLLNHMSCKSITNS